MWQNRGDPMHHRRDFLRLAPAGALWPPARTWAQKKPEGILVNDVHGQLSATYVNRIMQPEGLDALRAARRLAVSQQPPSRGPRGRPVSEKRALGLGGGRHSMGSPAFATGGVLVDTRRLNPLLNFGPE